MLLHLGLPTPVSATGAGDSSTCYGYHGGDALDRSQKRRGLLLVYMASVFCPALYQTPKPSYPIPSCHASNNDSNSPAMIQHHQHQNKLVIQLSKKGLDPISKGWFSCYEITSFGFNLGLHAIGPSRNPSARTSALSPNNSLSWTSNATIRTALCECVYSLPKLKNI